ncbi:MAG: hypothetical protein LBS79_06300, partial [Tannerella sp.]|nr:hypothetical protein [Tannerella sp.]
MCKTVIFIFFATCCNIITGAREKIPPVASIFITGDWQIQLEYAGNTAVFEISPVETVKVENEIIEKLPVFNPNTAGYARGTALKGVKAQECSAAGALIPNTLVVKRKDSAKPCIRGKDYELDEEWGTVGRLEGGDIGADTPVSVDYLYGLMRMDEIMVKKGKFTLHRGASHVANPGFSLSVSKKNPVIARILVTPRTKRLCEENLYPVLERNYPEPAKAKSSKAEQQIPKTLAKLKAGGKIRIMAWGDSVTDGSYLQD